MALRVLLADESTTIKKVMQLALQDFAVEVKTVHVGVDVLEVARTFLPDIVFADVLLQKKNGYEVCSDLKSDPQFESVPVVLMWSSFMEFDEKFAQEARANGRLEKPFDVEHLRKLVLELVPKTQSQRLAHFLQFPESASSELKREEDAKQTSAAAKSDGPPPIQAGPPPLPKPPLSKPPLAMTPPPIAPATTPKSFPITPPSAAAQRPADAKGPSSWNMESFDDISSFAESNDSANDPASSQTFSNLTSVQPDFAGIEDDPADEVGFSEFKLTTLTNPQNALGADQKPRQGLQERIEAFQNAEESDDPWSHQDLSRFKIDLQPISIQDDELDLNFEVSENEFSSPEVVMRGDRLSPFPDHFVSPPVELEFPVPASLDEISPLGLEEFSASAGDISLDLEVSGEEAFPIEPLQIEENLSRARATGAPHGRVTSEAIPQLSSERLEEIIRAQSREIIESVVRRIVPDIASEMIRQELARLLDESGTNQRPDWETRR